MDAWEMYLNDAIMSLNLAREETKKCFEDTEKGFEKPAAITWIKDAIKCADNARSILEELNGKV